MEDTQHILFSGLRLYDYAYKAIQYNLFKKCRI